MEYLYIKVKENMEFFDKYGCVCVERCENLRVILTIVLEIHRVENATPRHQGQNHPFVVFSSSLGSRCTQIIGKFVTNMGVCVSHCEKTLR